MKKKLVTLMAVIALLASSTAALADENVQAETNDVQGDIVVISDSIPVEDGEAVSNVSSYISNAVTVTEIGDGVISTSKDDEVINFTTSEDTLVIDAVTGDIKSLDDIKAEDVITVYTNAYAPAPLILPTQYQADVIVINSNDENAVSFIDVDTYVKAEEGVVNAANTLALNVAETTAVVDKEGNVYAESLENKDLVVIYTNSTRSIPAQTTPEKVVVLGENELALSQLANKDAENSEAVETPAPEATEAPSEEDVKVNLATVSSINVGDKTVEDVYTKGETVMVPLREIAEALGLSVEWDGELNAVMINGGVYSLKIGENSYVKGKMAPVELSAAPEITNDWTYVPVEYFFDVVEAKADVQTDENGNVQSLTLSAEIAE